MFVDKNMYWKESIPDLTTLEHLEFASVLT